MVGDALQLTKKIPCACQIELPHTCRNFLNQRLLALRGLFPCFPVHIHHQFQNAVWLTPLLKLWCYARTLIHPNQPTHRGEMQPKMRGNLGHRMASRQKRKCHRFIALMCARIVSERA